MSASTTVGYMERTREYYAAYGYEVPYKWAHFDSVPFSPLKKPLSECRVPVVTTAMPDASYTKKSRRLANLDPLALPTSLYTDELSWDHEATHTDDVQSFLPSEQLERRIEQGQLGSLSRQFHCIPTTYSHRQTIERDAPAIVAACIEDAVDVALLIPL